MAVKGVTITIVYRAWDTSANAPKTGDVANHLIRVCKDGTDAAATNTPTEISSTNRPGDYKLVLTSTEMNGDLISVGGKSSTSAIYIEGVQIDTIPDILTPLGVIDDFLDTEIAAIKAKTDLIPASPAAVGDVPTATQNADALLKRDWTAVTGEASRSVLNALRWIRNGFTTVGTTVTILKEDDSTPAYTRDLTTDAGAVPITGVG